MRSESGACGSARGATTGHGPDRAAGFADDDARWVALASPLDALGRAMIRPRAVWRCRPRSEQDRAETGEPTGRLAAARLIARNPVPASTTAMDLVFNVGLGALLVVMPVPANTVLGGRPALWRCARRSPSCALPDDRRARPTGPRLSITN